MNPKTARIRAIFDELAEALVDIIESDEYVDQHASPFGKRKHLALCRAGKLASHKAGQRVLVKRSEIERYLRTLPARVTVDAAADFEQEVAKEMREHERRSRKAG